MGALVHEGCWVDDAAVGGRVPLDASFYRELRDRIGLARWECGRLYGLSCCEIFSELRIATSHTRKKIVSKYIN